MLKADTDWFQNCICGTPIVPMLIANLVGLILQDKHDITYINTWGCLLMKKKLAISYYAPPPHNK